MRVKARGVEVKEMMHLGDFVGAKMVKSRVFARWASDYMGDGTRSWWSQGVLEVCRAWGT